jgi:regulation of enolase protein 1 (concanavalin A-like superfamily)
VSNVVAWNELTWLNAPLASEVSGGALRVKTRNATDLWQSTFYGFRRKDGHFLFQDVGGDFTASVRLTGKYETLYDQAGLMIRIDDAHWVKTGIEYTDGECYLSVVVTNNGFSDWSVLPYRHEEQEATIRLTRHGEAIRVQYEDPKSSKWTMARLGYLLPKDKVQIGIMCCSPEREGFEVTFRDFSVGPAIPRTLHEV